MSKEEKKAREKKERREPRKKDIRLYYDRVEPILQFSDERVGKWFRSIFNYDLYGEHETTGDEVVDLMISQTESDLDRGLEKYHEQCVKNKENRNAYKNKDDGEESENEVFKRLTKGYDS